MKTKANKQKDLFDLAQYGHFYAPKAIISFLVRSTQAESDQKVLGIGFQDNVLKNALPKGAELQTIQAEVPSSDRFAILSSQSFDIILCAPTFRFLLLKPMNPTRKCG